MTEPTSRPRGRPKGSRNLTPEERAVKEATKRPRGRYKGSRNKKVKQKSLSDEPGKPLARVYEMNAKGVPEPKPDDVSPRSRPQEMFLSSQADIAIIGGAGGGGKTFALLMEPLRHVNNKGFNAVFFRRTNPMITAPGSLWDGAMNMYKPLGAEPYKSPDMQFRFPSGATVRLRHMQFVEDRLDWKGAEIALILWDQLEEFDYRQFIYLLSRNRSTCGVKPYCRASCNPDPDCWLREFLGWWIDDEGYPISERSGVLRWMVVINNEITWGSSREELIGIYGGEMRPLSVTFIPAKIDDNRVLMEKDPGYKSKLMALPKHERAALLEGNWNARASIGAYFRKEWFGVAQVAPSGTKWVRYWDRASTLPHTGNRDPDYTAGVLLGKTAGEEFIVKDVARFRGTPQQVEQRILNVAGQDGNGVTIGLEQEPGSSGLSEVQYLAKKLQGFNVRINKKRNAKEVDWSPVSSQCEAGNVKVIPGAWNAAFFAEAEAVGQKHVHDDQVDAMSGAFGMLIGGRYTLANL